MGNRLRAFWQSLAAIRTSWEGHTAVRGFEQTAKLANLFCKELWVGAVRAHVIRKIFLISTFFQQFEYVFRSNCLDWVRSCPVRVGVKVDVKVSRYSVQVDRLMNNPNWQNYRKASKTKNGRKRNEKQDLGKGSKSRQFELQKTKDETGSNIISLTKSDPVPAALRRNWELPWGWRKTVSSKKFRECQTDVLEGAAVGLYRP